jgi:hypothetical protein
LATGASAGAASCSACVAVGPVGPATYRCAVAAGVRRIILTDADA